MEIYFLLKKIFSVVRITSQAEGYVKLCVPHGFKSSTTANWTSKYWSVANIYRPLRSRTVEVASFYAWY